MGIEQKRIVWEGEEGKKDWEREDRSEGEGEYSIRYNNNNIIIYNNICIRYNI